MKGGTLLILAGVWVLCQVFGGNALGRLGITDPNGPKYLGKLLPPSSGGGSGGGGGGSF